SWWQTANIIKVATIAWCRYFKRVGQLQLGNVRARIDVDDTEPCGIRAPADVGVGSFIPPRINLAGISGGVFVAVRCRWLFAVLHAAKHRPPFCSVIERSDLQRGLDPFGLIAGWRLISLGLIPNQLHVVGWRQVIF